MTKIVFLDRGTFAPEVELTRPDVEHEWVEHDNTAADQIVERLRVQRSPSPTRCRSGAKRWSNCRI
jgi:hypothetical protein